MEVQTRAARRAVVVNDDEIGAAGAALAAHGALPDDNRSRCLFGTRVLRRLREQPKDDIVRIKRWLRWDVNLDLARAHLGSRARLDAPVYFRVMDVLLGLAIAYVVVRTDLPGRGVLDALAMLPLAVPGLVLAFGYISMTQDGKLFAALNPGKNPMLLLIIAYAMRRLPYVVRSAVAGLEQTPRDLELAALNLGAGAWTTLRRITVRNSSFSIRAPTIARVAPDATRPTMKGSPNLP